MFKSVGIRSIAVNFPSVVRTNDFWRKNYPELVTKAEQKSLARAFSSAKSNNDELDLWTQEMTPYLSDPFRGTIERRVLAPHESLLQLEYKAAKDAIASARLNLHDIDLMLVSSLFPEQLIPGNAATLAGKLGLRGAAWNVEATCMSGLVALQTAFAMIRAGQYRNVLVVTSTNFSRHTREDDTLSILAGDGAGAFVVSALETEQGILSIEILNTSETCGAFVSELTRDSLGNPWMCIQSRKGANKMFCNTIVKFARECCANALAAAGVSIEEIDFFVFNTPQPWAANVYIKALGIDPERTIDLSLTYNNIGPVSILANMYHAALSGKIARDDLVLVYNFGATSNAGATVMRWGDVGLGQAPTPSATLINQTVGEFARAC